MSNKAQAIKTMKFMDLLRKLGIFRSGSVSGTYKNAVDRPTELQMDDVFDAKKDLTTKEDLKKVKEKFTGVDLD